MDEPKPKKGGKKGNKKRTTVVSAPKIEEEVIDESTPWKGKPSSFFNMPTAKQSLNDD